MTIKPRSVAAACVVLITTACTPSQLEWWVNADREQRDAGMVHVIREAAREFDVDEELMVRIARCESGLNPAAKNPRSTASGLFQHLERPYWPARAEAVGMPGASVFDPIANSRAAANMIAHAGTSAWDESRGCWNR